MLHVRICAGGREQSRSLPRPNQHPAEAGPLRHADVSVWPAQNDGISCGTSCQLVSWAPTLRHPSFQERTLQVS